MTPATCGRPWATGRSSTASTRPRGLAAGGWGELESAWDATRFEAAMEADPGSEERTRLVSDLVGTFFRSYSVQAEGQREAYLSGQELGEDVLVRLAGRKLYAIDSWQIVKELFQAQTVDPRLRSHAWIADRLLELAGGGPPPARGGYLDAEAVWPLLLGRLIGLEGERPDLSVLLRWSSAAENVQRLRRLAEEVRQALSDWLAA